MNAFLILVRKDLRMMVRRRGGVLSALGVGAIVMLMASVAGDATPEGLARRGAQAFWLGVFLGSTLLLSDAFDAEQRGGAQRSLILLGASPTAFFYAKAVANFAGLFMVGAALTPIAIALFGVSLDPFGGACLLATGALSLAAPGTLFTALVAESEKRNLLLPILVFPLVLPVLIGVVQTSLLLVFGDPMNQRGAWMSLLGVFALLHWILDGALYEKGVD